MILTPVQIAWLVVVRGFVNQPTAVAVALAESGGNTLARNHVDHPGSPADGSWDRGLWQINSYWHAEVSDAQADDPVASTDATFRISSGGRSWTPWTTYTSGAYLRYLTIATEAVNAVPSIVTREQGGIVPVTHTTAKVTRPARWLLVHHTGDTGWPKAGWSDRQHMTALQQFSSGAGKTWEYNYVITYPTGVIWEQAGEFQAAHCLNANGWSYGVQINQAASAGHPPQQIVDAFRWLRSHLVDTGQLAPDHQCVPHYRLRSTACSSPDLAEPPGDRWSSPTGEGSLGDVIPSLLVPWDGGKELDVPFTTDDVNVLRAIATETVKQTVDQTVKQILEEVGARVWNAPLPARYDQPEVPAEERLTAARASAGASYDQGVAANTKLDALQVPGGDVEAIRAIVREELDRTKLTG